MSLISISLTAIIRSSPHCIEFIVIVIDYGFVKPHTSLGCRSRNQQKWTDCLKESYLRIVDWDWIIEAIIARETQQ